MQITLILYASPSRIVLETTLFNRSESTYPSTAIRGSGLGHTGIGLFPLSKAVKGLTLLLLEHAVVNASSDKTQCALIEGRRGSLAASLDYALSKQPQWMCDMFGTDAAGDSLLKRMVRRTNSHLKRPGPVRLSIPPSCALKVKVFVNEVEIEEAAELSEILSQLTNENTEKASPPLASAVQSASQDMEAAR